MCSLCDNDYSDEDFDYEDGDYSYLGGSSDKVEVDKLRDELTYITVYPEFWNQGDWVNPVNREFGTAETPPPACGTMGCLAGNTVLHEGGELQWVKGDYWDYETNAMKFYWRTEYVIMPQEFEEEHIDYAARKTLGLNSDQADALFDGGNDLDDLWEKAYAVSDGKITPDDRRAAERQLAERVERGEVKAREEIQVNA